MEVLLAVDLGQRPLPGAVGGVPEDVAQQHETGAVVETVGYHQLGPTLQGHVEGVRMLEVPGVTLVDEGIGVDAEVAQHAIGDVRVAQLVLDDAQRGDIVVHAGQARRVAHGVEVGRPTDELGIGRDDERAREPRNVGRRGLLRPLQQLSARNALPQDLFGRDGHRIISLPVVSRSHVYPVAPRCRLS